MLKTMNKLSELLNYQSIQERMTKKEDRSLNKPNLIRSRKMRQKCYLKLRDFAHIRIITVNALKNYVCMHIVKKNLMKLQLLNNQN